MDPFFPSEEILQCYISINGVDTGLDSLLIDASIQFEVNKIGFGKFTFVDKDPSIPNSDPLPTDVFNKKKTGEALDIMEIKVMWNKKKETLFKGFVKAVDKVIEAHQMVCKVECKDVSHLLTLPCKIEEGEVKAFEEKTMEEKIDFFTRKFNVELNSTMLGQSWGLEKVTYNHSIPPWDFIVSFLDSIGILVTARNGIFQGVDILNEEIAETIVLENGLNIFSFSGKIDDSKRLGKVNLVSWDSDKQEKVVTESKPGEGASTGALSTEIRINNLSYTASTAKRVVDAVVAKSDLAAVQGKVQTYGNLQGRCGDYMRVNHANDALKDKKILITREAHSLENGLWKTEYSFGVESNKTFAENISSGKMDVSSKLGSTNTLNGLQLAIVTDIDDPNQSGRVKVTLPMLYDNGSGNWARVSNLFTGNEIGSFFMPEVGDEVVVCGIGGSPEHLIVLGSLYNASKKPPRQITKDNYIKGIYTKNNLFTEWDDEKKSIELHTPGGNKLLLSEEEKGIILEDENQNKIIMNAEGITIESASDLVLKATGNLKMEATGITGNASGIMELKGSLIKLN